MSVATAHPEIHASGSADQAPVIELDNLHLKFGKNHVLRGLTANLTGRSIGLLGPNGSGKTSMIHTLLGFHPPADGTARLFGHDIQTDARWIKRHIGYMPERDSFIAGMSAVRFVRLMAELSGLPPGLALERTHEALYYVGLGEARYRKLESYSLGMKQQAKLAQALVHGPELLILDEPTNGLDPPHRKRMIDLIQEIRDSGEITLILSSHLLRDVEECCEEVLVLKNGEIAKYCNLEEERRANKKFVEVEADGDRDRLAQAFGELGCELALHGPTKIKLVLPDGIDVRQLYELAARESIGIRQLKYKRDTLEDVFLEAMEAHRAGL